MTNDRSQIRQSVQDNFLTCPCRWRATSPSDRARSDFAVADGSNQTLAHEFSILRWQIHRRRTTPRKIDKARSAESFSLLTHLSGHVIAELLLDILLGLRIEVGHVEHPANFDH